MKTKFLFFLLLFAAFGRAQETVTLKNVASFEGEEVMLCETVTGTHQTKSDSHVTYLNFGKAYPNNAFTVVIFKKSLEKFSYDPLTLKGKKICITGKVAFYKGKPQIVVQNESQISIP
jgi:DNA/RNA endonuclease YhcR with UshA esterase domain